MRSILVLLACMVLAACDLPFVGNDENALRVERDGDAVVLSTDSEDPFYYFAVDAAVLPFISTALCLDPISCPMVRRGKSVRITRSELSHEGRVASIVSVTYYHLRPTLGTPPFREDVVRYTQKGF